MARSPYASHRAGFAPRSKCRPLPPNVLAARFFQAERMEPQPSKVPALDIGNGRTGCFYRYGQCQQPTVLTVGKLIVLGWCGRMAMLLPSCACVRRCRTGVHFDDAHQRFLRSMERLHSPFITGKGIASGSIANCANGKNLQIAVGLVFRPPQ